MADATMLIHPLAAVDPAAHLGADVRIGPFAVVEADAEIGDGCRISAHAVIRGGTRMGAGNLIGEHAVVGGDPQHLSWKGEPVYLVIGSGNIIREGATLHRASRPGEATVVGDNCFIMAYAHVGHDCRIASQVILANGALLAGHVEVGERAFVSGNVAVHQFTRIGRCAMVSGLARISQDCLPFMITEGSPARTRAVNTVGLRRAGFTPQDIRAARDVLHRLRVCAKLEDALQDLESGPPLAREIAAFIRSSPRGFTHPRRA